MLELTFTFCRIILYIGIFFALYRMFKGPRLVDRVMSLDALSVCVIAILVVSSIQYKSAFYIDLILVFSLLNFIGTVAYVFYLNKTYEPYPDENTKRPIKKKKKFLKGGR